MLKHLKIKNFAIIEEVSLSFNSGMTTLTGETGAGKSIIIDAVGLLAGGRGSSEFVRHGTKKCVLEGNFSLPSNTQLLKILEEEAIETDANILDIQREIYDNGRSVCRVNGSMITIGKLKEIGNFLIDIHGQNEHQELMNMQKHLQLLDSFGDEQLINIAQEYNDSYKRYKKIKTTLQQWTQNEKEVMQQLDMYDYQMTEIQNAQLQIDEEETLLEEQQKLANFQAIKTALAQSYFALQNDTSSGLDYLGVAMEAMESIEAYDPQYGAISQQLTDLFYSAQDIASEILSLKDDLEYDEERLQIVMERLELIQQLKRKYGNSIPEILNYYEEISQKHHRYKTRDTKQRDLQEEMKRLEKQVLDSGRTLSKLRRKIGQMLEKEVKQQLQDLYMEHAQFAVLFEKDVNDTTISDATYSGLDVVEFYVATNLGEPLKPLAKIASGGELSRLMLAVKSIFSNAQGVSSIIFDEIDTGVSGRVAQAIANKMHHISLDTQVLAVSHLPQVAAVSEHHLYVHKTYVEDQARTITDVKELSEEERIQEIARMLSGEEVTSAALEAARELRK
ncbi:DNA repair protein RecN [Allofustis seminis]|uniref:DNA repair protein RecN n=1 Tax=Allofustis seminis TaxID=166939 RepID=UPI00036DEA69|nr:DNA repair protein RecN [Allofustis seminis]